MNERRQFASIARRLMALAAALALVVLVTHSVVHWHGSGHREDHCQICHVGHAAIPQPRAQVALQAPTLVARVAIVAAAAPHLDFLSTPSIPRAPPA